MRKPEHPDVIAVVTVNWNGWALTLRCLEALRQSRDAAWRLIIVDNASTDGSLEHLRNLGDDVTLIEAPINSGWTGGNNLGVRAALDAGYRHIFVLNNDAFVEPDTLKVLLRTKAELGDAIIGPIHMDGSGKRFDYLGSDIDPQTGLSTYKDNTDRKARALPPLIETSTIKGAGIFAGGDQFVRLGLFDDRFYLTFDETDWCFRARAAGYPLRIVKDARIRHLGSATIGRVDGPLKVYFMTRNGLLFAEKHCSPKQRWTLLRLQFWNATRSWAQRNPGQASSGRTRLRFGLLFSADPHDAAYRLGVLHYLLRRFGDCPAAVRDWNREPASAPTAQTAPAASLRPPRPSYRSPGTRRAAPSTPGR